MKKLKVADLKPGMKFSKPIFMDGENILAPAGLPIKEKDIERLLRWEVLEVQTEGELVREGGESSPEEKVRAEEPARELSPVFKEYLKAVEVVNGVFEAVKAGKEVHPNDIDRLINAFFPLIKDHTDEVTSFTIKNERTKHSRAQGAVNCMILSVVMGMSLKFPAHKLVQLAQGALLHDVGMTKIPEAILGKQGDLTPDETKAMRTHTLHAYKIITKDFKYPNDVGLIALHHHERWDGKGYPKQLAGKDIPLSARIVSVADAFEAMVKDRPYRNSLIGYTAMRQILNDNSRRYDAEIIKVFIQSLGIYPIGSIVILNDGTVGKVVKIHKDAPLRPELSVIVDKRGAKAKEGEKTIDLLNQKDLFIAKAINPQELAGKKQ